MLTSTTTMLRSGMGRSAGALQPILFRAAACPYSTATLVSPFSVPKQARPAKPQPAHSRPLSTACTKSTSPPTLVLRLRTPAACRNASTARSRSDAETDANAAEAAAAAQVAAHAGEASLDWNTFFKLRKTRRRLQQVFSVVGALGGGTAGATFLSMGLAESVVSQVPLDPFVTLGLMTFSCSALGWLLGPVMGTMVFNLFHRRVKGQMAVKESQFFARIKKHRANPTSSSVSNPVPDFYGEKISSVLGYRQWLKDQRVYIKKQTAPFL